jgi:hypothetical protein
VTQLAADQAITGGKDYCMIWEVFAARGLGAKLLLVAEKGDDQVEDFTIPVAGSSTFLESMILIVMMMTVFSKPSNGQINVRISKYFGKVDIQVIDITEGSFQR